MNHIILFIALFAACILVMPALSMPDSGNCANKNKKFGVFCIHKLIAIERGGCQGLKWDLQRITSGNNFVSYAKSP